MLRFAACGISAALLAACGQAGNLTIRNDGSTDVTVSTGESEVRVEAGTGAAILEYGCSPGDVAVEFGPGDVVVVPGPVCPEDRIVVGDGTVTLQPI